MRKNKWGCEKIKENLKMIKLEGSEEGRRRGTQGRKLISSGQN